jgi:hypothetical protein
MADPKRSPIRKTIEVRILTGSFQARLTRLWVETERPPMKATDFPGMYLLRDTRQVKLIV